MNVKNAFLNGVISEEVYVKPTSRFWGFKTSLGQVDTTLLRRTLGKDILIVQIYVDDIIFSNLMEDVFEMSMMGELKFFLEIQINQCKDGVYVHHSKYTKELI